MAFTSIGFGQTCSSSTLPRWCARTSFIPSIRSVPKVVFFAGDFFAILLQSFQMSRELPHLFLFVRGKVRSDILRVTAEQIDARGKYHIYVDDPRAASLPLALRRPSQLPCSAGTRDHVARIGMFNQIDGKCLNSVRTDQLCRLGLELGQLEDRDFGRIVHCS